MIAPTLIRPPRNKKRQRGAAIIIMALILMLGLVTLFTFRMDRRGPELEADRKTAMALAQAKEALLGSSATNGIATASTENPGRLPCPDLDNDGGWGAGLPPACTSKVGRLPWKFLGIGDLRDGAAEGLWYVVDPDFLDDGAWMNSGKTPTLAINGNQVVAVIIAPGPALAGQQRDTANENILSNYLESYVTPTIINLNPPSLNYNDRIITITARELFSVVTFRMAKDLADLNSTPYPSSFSGLNTSSAVWGLNKWTNAVDFSLTTMKSTSINLKFQNCAIIYTISGPTVIRNQSSC